MLIEIPPNWTIVIAIFNNFNLLIFNFFTRLLNDWWPKPVEEDNEPSPPPPEDKYLEKYKTLKSKNIPSALPQPTNYIIEATPLGNVLMSYDGLKGSFQYYSDNTIPYKLLEVCSRKYVITYHCLAIYADATADDDEMPALIPLLPAPIPVRKASVFANFKSYNKGGKGVSAGTPLPVPTKLIEKNINRYTYLGKMCNFDFMKKKDYVATKIEEISYAAFKKMRAATESGYEIIRVA